MSIIDQVDVMWHNSFFNNEWLIEKCFYMKPILVNLYGA